MHGPCPAQPPRDPDGTKGSEVEQEAKWWLPAQEKGWEVSAGSLSEPRGPQAGGGGWGRLRVRAGRCSCQGRVSPQGRWCYPCLRLDLCGWGWEQLPGQRAQPGSTALLSAPPRSAPRRARGAWTSPVGTAAPRATPTSGTICHQDEVTTFGGTRGSLAQLLEGSRGELRSARPTRRFCA